MYKQCRTRQTKAIKARDFRAINKAKVGEMKVSKHWMADADAAPKTKRCERAPVFVAV